MTKIYGVGQRVRCINGKFDPFVWEFVDDVPVEGGIYTTSRIFFEANGREIGDIAPGLFFEEIPEGLPGHEGRICWEARRFDPIEDVDEARKRAAQSPRPRRKKALRIRTNRHPVVA